MRTLKVTDQLAPKYHGAGYALAAITGGQLIDGRGTVCNRGSAAWTTCSVFCAAVAWHCAEPVVLELQALGEVSVGMLSGWEFTEL